MFSPFIPHAMEEVWERLKKKKNISQEKWPIFTKKYVDVKIKNQWDAFDNLVDDIKNIIKVIKEKSHSEIIIVVADEWRNKLVLRTLDLFKKGTDVGSIMKELMKEQEFKKYGKEINSLLRKITSNIGKYTIPFKTQSLEFKFWKQVSGLIRNRFNLKIEIQSELESKESKKNQALPGKPAIIIK